MTMFRRTKRGSMGRVDTTQCITCGVHNAVIPMTDLVIHEQQPDGSVKAVVKVHDWFVCRFCHTREFRG